MPSIHGIPSPPRSRSSRLPFFPRVMPWAVQLDIMDRGTDVRSFLLGNVIPLRLGSRWVHQPQPRGGTHHGLDTPFCRSPDAP